MRKWRLNCSSTASGARSGVEIQVFRIPSSVIRACHIFGTKSLLSAGFTTVEAMIDMVALASAQVWTPGRRDLALSPWVRSAHSVDGSGEVWLLGLLAAFQGAVAEHVNEAFLSHSCHSFHRACWRNPRMETKGARGGVGDVVKFPGESGRIHPFLSHSTELFCALGSASTTSLRDRASITISCLDSSKHCPCDFLVPSLAPFRPFSSGCQSELEERVTCPSECSTSCSRRTAPHAFPRATRDPFLSAPAWHPLPAFSLLFRGCHPAGRQKDSLEPGGQQDRGNRKLLWNL
ncbi:uncharacterized protein LOC129022577 isoform X2 [Pongo pygmaeus]|uniref:uncharacterized protein LOC129022577 isoform X2 n=1 Tax=Pongo pygmaeus TaxID=9600 RepID=UPI00300C6DC1